MTVQRDFFAVPMVTRVHVCVAVFLYSWYKLWEHNALYPQVALRVISFLEYSVVIRTVVKERKPSLPWHTFVKFLYFN